MNVSEVRNEEGFQKAGQLSRKEEVTAQHFVLRVKSNMVSLFFSVVIYGLHLDGNL